MPHTYRSVMLETASCQTNQFILQVWNLCHAPAAKEGFLNHIFRKSSLTCIHNQLPVFCLAVGKRHGKRTDSAFIASPAAAGISFGEHLVLCHSPFPAHQALRHRAAVEKNHFVFILAIVIVPVQYRCGLFTCQMHGTHGQCRTHINLAGSHNSPVIQFTEQHAGADAQHFLHLVPAPQRQRVQTVAFYVLIQHSRYFGQCQQIGPGHPGAVRIRPETIQLRLYRRVTVLFLPHLKKQLRQIEGFHIDTIFLQSYLVKPHCLKGGGTGADTAHIKPLHSIDHPAYSGKIPQILRKRLRQRMHHMGFQHRKWHLILGEHVRNGEFPTIRIPPVGKIHLTNFIRISLHQNGHTCIL